MTLAQLKTPRLRRDAGVSCQVIETVDGLERYEGEWDRLAVECGKPTCRPAWLRAWWEAACIPADRASRALRLVVATEARRLVAVFPWYLFDRNSFLPEMRLLGQGGFWSIEPLVSHDAPPGTLAVVAQALSETAPRPARLLVTPVSTEAEWPLELRRRWPGGPAWLRRGRQGELLVIEGPIPFDAWVASRPRPWRTEYRRLARRRAEAGLEIRCSETSGEVEDDIRALAQLHHARLNWQSGWLNQRVEHTIIEAARLLVGSGGVRVWKVVRGEELVAATLFARAGDVSEVLLTAFDPAWTSLGPGLGSIVAGIEHDLETGVRLIDFGHGGFKYLRRLSNAARPVVPYELFPCNRTMPIAAVRWLLPHARERLRPRERLQAWLGA